MTYLQILLFGKETNIVWNGRPWSLHTTI